MASPAGETITFNRDGTFVSRMDSQQSQTGEWQDLGGTLRLTQGGGSTHESVTLDNKWELSPDGKTLTLTPASGAQPLVLTREEAGQAAAKGSP